MPTEHDTSRADGLLRKMHPVFSHDLPNQALVEVLRCLIDRRGAGPCGLRLDARAGMDGTELRGDLVWQSGAAPASVKSHAPDRAPLEQRPEIVLAQELLAAWGARLTD